LGALKAALGRLEGWKVDVEHFMIPASQFTAKLNLEGMAYEIVDCDPHVPRCGWQRRLARCARFNTTAAP
jgi:hypothetical protein